VCEVLPITAGLRGSALSTLVVGVTPDTQSPITIAAVPPTTRSPLTSYDQDNETDDVGSRAPSNATSVYDHEMEDHFTALLPDEAQARDKAFFNGFYYPPKLATTHSNSNYNYNRINTTTTTTPSSSTINPTNPSGRFSLREDLGLARTHSRREMQSHTNLSGRSYGELSDSDYRERRGRLDHSNSSNNNILSSSPRSTFSIFLPWTWFEEE